MVSTLVHLFFLAFLIKPEVLHSTRGPFVQWGKGRLKWVLLDLQLVQQFLDLLADLFF